MADVSNSKLLHIDTGILSKDACVVLVKTEWNNAVTDELEAGSRRVFEQYGITKVITVTVPGAVEIPFTIKRYWDTHNWGTSPDAFIAFGCVVRGDTPHFDYVCQAVTDGIGRLNLELPVPTIFGVLTVDNNEQAAARIGGAHGHKGEEAAITAIKMIAMNKSFNQQVK